MSLFFQLSLVHFVLRMKTKNAALCDCEVGALWLSSGEGHLTSHRDLARVWWSSQAGEGKAVGQTNNPGVKHIWVPILARQLLFLVTGAGHSMPLNLSLSICIMEIVTPTLGVAVRLNKGVPAQGICLMNVARVTMASRFPKEGPQLPHSSMLQGAGYGDIHQPSDDRYRDTWLGGPEPPSNGFFSGA